MWGGTKEGRRLSSSEWTDKRRKISAPANYNRADERDQGERKERKSLLFSHLRGRGEVNPPTPPPPPPLKLNPEEHGGLGVGGLIWWNVEVISRRSSSSSWCLRIKKKEKILKVSRCNHMRKKNPAVTHFIQTAAQRFNLVRLFLFS